MISIVLFGLKNTPLTPLKGGIRCANFFSLTRMDFSRLASPSLMLQHQAMVGDLTNAKFGL